MDSNNMTKSDGSDEMVIREVKELEPETSVSVKSMVLDGEKPLPAPAILFSPRPVSELDAAAVKLQKVYKSYRTRRNLADCAVVVEELWWKALDFARLKESSVSFFNTEKPDTAASRWRRAGTKSAKIGNGLSKDGKAQKLAITHWLEAVSPHCVIPFIIFFNFIAWMLIALATLH